MIRELPTGIISNEHRTSSLSIPSVEAEMADKLGGGEDPLEILIRIEELYGTVTDDDLEVLPIR